MEKAYTIAKEHNLLPITNISYYPLSENKNLHIQTLFTPGEYEGIDNVVYVDIEDDNGDCIETDTIMYGDIEGLTLSIYELCNR